VREIFPGASTLQAQRGGHHAYDASGALLGWAATGEARGGTGGLSPSSWASTLWALWRGSRWWSNGGHRGRGPGCGGPGWPGFSCASGTCWSSLPSSWRSFPSSRSCRDTSPSRPSSPCTEPPSSGSSSSSSWLRPSSSPSPGAPSSAPWGPWRRSFRRGSGGPGGPSDTRWPDATCGSCPRQREGCPGRRSRGPHAPGAHRGPVPQHGLGVPLPHPGR